MRARWAGFHGGVPARCAALAVGPILALAGCATKPTNTTAAPPAGATATRYHGGDAPLSRAADGVMVTIPAGHFIAGSTRAERAVAYDDYFRTAGHDAARRGKWFDRERSRSRRFVPAYVIDLSPVTNAAYAEFVADTRRAPPRIDARAWAAQRVVQDYERQVKRYNWIDGRPPAGRADHPVLLVTWQDAADYCTWRGNLVGKQRRLPSEDEFEKAARGANGFFYPWGNEWDKTRLNSAETAPDDTVSVGKHPQGKSPYGVLGMAGNVFQWTSTLWEKRQDMRTVKGSAWEDHAGVGRGASRHGRLVSMRHAIIGFRCAGPAQ